MNAVTGSPGATGPGRIMGAAALLAVEGLLIFVPAVVLGQAVNWPQGLDDPAAVTLPLVAENEAALRLGYLAYLAYSLLFLPVIAALVTVLTGPEGRLRPVARIAVILAAVSALARGVGILRWLTVMPGLAESWVGADPALRQVLSVQFQAVNDYGGGIGELLGVSALGSAAVACAVIATRELAPTWLTWLGAAVAVASALPLAGVDAGALTSVGVAAVQLWFLAAAAVLATRARRRHR
ncbi:DUF4386 domain-containing protein [Streptosporangium saharense]|uniref:DUF4386 domain-containing protein n=1 Tax=Streptosporangium saharense TaxID=1706840 RepID=UPI0036A9FB44